MRWPAPGLSANGDRIYTMYMLKNHVFMYHMYNMYYICIYNMYMCMVLLCECMYNMDDICRYVYDDVCMLIVYIYHVAELTMFYRIVYIWARVKRRYERLQLRSVITTQNMWFTVCSDRGPYVAIPLFRLCLWLKLPVGRMTFRSFDVRVRHWSSRSGLVFLGSCKMACHQVYMR